MQSVILSSPVYDSWAGLAKLQPSSEFLEVGSVGGVDRDSTLSWPVRSASCQVTVMDCGQVNTGIGTSRCQVNNCYTRYDIFLVLYR